MLMLPENTTELPVPRAPRPSDIEELVQWAVSRSGRLPWLRTGWRELEMNQGLTARPKRRPPTNWILAEATAGLTLRGRSFPAMMTTAPDAQLVLSAIAALDDPAAAATVLACARGRIRPDWMEGIEPKRVLRSVYGTRKNRKRRGRAIMVPVWEPCSPADVKAARDNYTRWHKALETLAERFKPGGLAEWIVTGFEACAAPWETAPENNT
jgi:hypothetical protein